MKETMIANLMCPICGKPNMQVKVKGEIKENLSNKNIGYTENPCDSCQKMKEMGKILIGIDNEKTKDEFNPYRTGHIFVVKKDDEYFKVFPDVCFIDFRDLIELGLIKKGEENAQIEKIQMEENPKE